MHACKNLVIKKKKKKKKVKVLHEVMFALQGLPVTTVKLSCSTRFGPLSNIWFGLAADRLADSYCYIKNKLQQKKITKFLAIGVESSNQENARAAVTFTLTVCTVTA